MRGRDPGPGVISLVEDGALWTIRLDRPEKANALTEEMLEEIAAIADRANGAARVVVLTGAGTVFSAGADLEGMRAGLGQSAAWERASGALAALPCLTIAALNGTLAGGAFGVALACDIRLAVDGAKFFYPVMALGFRPQPSDPGRLAALVGPARARLILLAGARLTAPEALAIGLVDKVTSADQLATEVAAMAAPPLAASTAHVAALKALTRI